MFHRFFSNQKISRNFTTLVAAETAHRWASAAAEQTERR